MCIRDSYQGGPVWDKGGPDYKAGPPGRAHVQGGVAEERADHDDLRWDAGECRVQQLSHSYHQVGQPGVVEGHECTENLPWDTGGRCEVAVGHDPHVDQLCYEKGEDEPPLDEVSSEVDVFVAQVPPTKDKGDNTEQENDVQVPVLMGGGDLAKSRLCSNGSTRFLLRT